MHTFWVGLCVCVGGVFSTDSHSFGKSYNSPQVVPGGRRQASHISMHRNTSVHKKLDKIQPFNFTQAVYVIFFPANRLNI